jgi:threonine/homoserine/homoserine lactone efflux protein
MIDLILSTLAMAFLVGLTGALAPGPTLVAAVNSSLKSGWTAGPKVALGHAAVEVAIFLLIVQGMSLASQRYEGIIAVLGGASLVIFGALTIQGSRTASLARQEGRRIENPFLAGMITSAANPYFWIWWLSIGSALLLDSLSASLLLAVAFMIGHWSADIGWYTLVSTSLEKGRTVLSDASYKGVLALCGSFLVLFGLYYLSRAWTLSLGQG